MSPATGPHARLNGKDARERLLAALFDELWEDYRERVSYVREYERIVHDLGASFLNDHIAFRTFATQRPPAGIAGVARVFQALGYVAAGCYHFPDKQLSAVHLQHPRADFPKLFVSELLVWELPADARGIIGRLTANHREPIELDALAELAALQDDAAVSGLLRRLLPIFQELPWPPPEQSDVSSLAKANQYAAWVAVHGYRVNHFTSLINSHRVAALDDIEKTIAALRDAGVPMKAEIEGAPGSRLRQSATEAVTIDVNVLENGRATTMPWSYAYFELAERGDVVDPQTGARARFEGFLGPQATNLFEMTRLKGG